HLFVPREYRATSYIDSPLPIGKDQTISQPYIVALMSEALEVEEGARILEIGTGSGYQAAVLSLIADSVFSVEIIPELAQNASSLLDSLGYDNVEVLAGDGFDGWPAKAPFDGIIVTAAAPVVPRPLVDQLRTGGRLVIPVGRFPQRLLVYVKREGGLEELSSTPVRFVPMTGKVNEEEER
ncbi:MAG TPA: protein-L-isoaspartate(D-aspartate) O-methyltransferase, partial [Candidatus Krumholzibacterium sp.]|nr:protein-L-isoaspartate(D-aspartate) O-methyltransferase [Candidatus Krumholzibacterium sp.]